jgi:hypothetical protein
MQLSVAKYPCQFIYGRGVEMVKIQQPRFMIPGTDFKPENFNQEPVPGINELADSF